MLRDERAIKLFKNSQDYPGEGEEMYQELRT
jgi:hypothetical protein